MSIDRTSPSTPRCGWAVYYADHRIVVTSWYVETRVARYPIAELEGVLRHLTFRHPGRAVGLIVGGVEVALVLPLSAVFRSFVMVLTGLVMALGMGVGVLLDARRNPRWMEIRAQHHHTDVLLFGTRDKAEFARVRRALIRAVEINRDSRP
jgi:hypothetical protein